MKRRGSARRLCSHALVAVLAALPLRSLAANPCEGGGLAAPPALSEPGGGIGGTGRAGGESGIGGTGRSAEGGIGGTGHTESGIGGTGRGPGEPGDGGIGGTGHSRAIFGTVTGYASLCIAGIEVRFDAASLAGDEENGSASPTIGETVEVIANGDGDTVHAVSIARQPAVVGPVESIDAAAGEMRVLGQRIVFDTATRSAKAGAQDTTVADSGIAAGDRVRVSGLRRGDGDVIASRVDRAAGDRVLLVGSVSGAGAGWIEIGGARIDVSTLAGAAHATAATPAAVPAIGEDVVVSGRLDGTRIVAASSHRFLDFLSRRDVGRADVETWMTGDAHSVAVGSRELDVPTSQRVAGGGRVRVTALVEPNGALVFEHLRPVLPWHPPALLQGFVPPGARGSKGDAPDRRGLFPPRPGGRPDRPERPERPEFPDRPPPRPPRPDRPPPPPPPMIERLH